ncbi:MAG: beta-N-acetylhexosaminidase [Bacteroidota bacterium]|nr:beta-N-acetylhexosaminidase [Bacteroidota bacterium]
MKNFYILFFYLISAFCFGQKQGVYPIIPMPTEIIPSTGSFILSDSVVIISNKESREAIYLQQYLKNSFSLNIKIMELNDNSISKNFPVITIYKFVIPDTTLSYTEAYTLDVTKRNIIISADQPSGIFYGIQSLIQLIPLQGKLNIPCLRIYDKPSYAWRGMHLDCSRHFFTKQEVMKYIDYLAMYKLNTFHWHLTDDQGWRIEIKKYPLLTTIGSQRKQTLIGKPSKKNKYDGKSYGGFYTQEEIKEVVAYAKERHITVVPEIEMPGHSLAALAAYPQYSCKGGKFEVGDTWGVYDDVYCAGNDSTFIFLEDILSEVCDLFPSTYIHIGGDECPKERWKTCAKCQKRMKDEDLKNEHALQSYFITRIEKFVNTKQKQIIGWDEILEGGLAPNAVVMSWRGTEGGIIAAKQKHYVVMSPGKPCYFDHYQSKNKSKEPIAIGGFNPLDSVYKYKPTPKELSVDEGRYIMGAQGNVWTEYITTFKKVEYMSIPRMAALSEALWLSPEKKNYKDFVSRLKVHSKLLDKMKVNYAKHFLIKK